MCTSRVHEACQKTGGKGSGKCRTDVRGTNAADIEAMGVLMTVEEYARLAGISRVQAARLCREGKLHAVKVGALWRINTRKALEGLGLLDPEPTAREAE